MFDWPYIRGLYEAGSTAYQLAKRRDFPSKQAIQNRATKEGWLKPEAGTHRLPIVAEALNIDSSKLTDDLLRTILGLISEGATIEIACKCAGIAPATWSRWCAKDTQLMDATRRARAGTVMSWINTVHQATQKDWKAATWLMQNSPDTRDSFGPKGSDNKLEVIINIDRDKGVTIDGETV